jgi:hypothetical protein
VRAYRESVVDDVTDADGSEPEAEPGPEAEPEAEPEADPESDAWERPIDRFRRSSAGTVIAAGLLGVRDALEGRPEREEPAIVAEAPEPKLDHIDIVLDPEHPERSRAVVYLPPHDDTDEG